MRMSVAELAGLWHKAAEELAEHAKTPTDLAKAEQLEACARDLVNCKFHHELVQEDHMVKSKFYWRFLK